MHTSQLVLKLASQEVARVRFCYDEDPLCGDVEVCGLQARALRHQLAHMPGEVLSKFGRFSHAPHNWVWLRHQLNLNAWMFEVVEEYAAYDSVEVIDPPAPEHFDHAPLRDAVRQWD